MQSLGVTKSLTDLFIKTPCLYKIDPYALKTSFPSILKFLITLYRRYSVVSIQFYKTELYKANQNMCYLEIIF